MLSQNKIPLTCVFILIFSLYLGLVFYTKSSILFIELFRDFNAKLIVTFYSGTPLKIVSLSNGIMLCLGVFINLQMILFGHRIQRKKEAVKGLIAFNHLNLLKDFKYTSWLSYFILGTILIMPALHLILVFPMVLISCSFYLGLWVAGEIHYWASRLA